VGGLLDEIKDVLRQRFDAYVAAKAASHVARREREQLRQIEAKLDRFATRLEAALTAAEMRIESLRRLEEELRVAVGELRERTGELRITGMKELLVLIDSLRHAGPGGPVSTEAAVNSAIRRLGGEPRRPGEETSGLHSRRATPDPPARPAPTTFAEVEAWRPDADMRLMQVDPDAL